MQEYDQQFAMDTEKYLVPSETWHTCGAPTDAIEVAEEGTAEGIPSGIAKHPTLGWVVLMSAGQGPFVAWAKGWEIESIKGYGLPLVEGGFTDFAIGDKPD